MGLFGFGSSSSMSPAEKKKKIRESYDQQIKSAQWQLDEWKKQKAYAQNQLKSTKDASWKRTIQSLDASVKNSQAIVKSLKEQKTRALNNV